MNDSLATDPDIACWNAKTRSYDLSAAAVLNLAADTLYGDPAETTDDGRLKAFAVIEGLLDAAEAGRFGQCAGLRAQLAKRAMDAAGHAPIAVVMRSAGLSN